MKQTQTKLFDFSDVGLNFCAGSKSLFPDRFKKMLSSGYNTQTVASVAVAGNQVTLTYGVSHGYAADRVLKIESGILAGINGGEFWIDSVTTNTLTFTLDDAPVSIAGAFTTKIASLGWELVFEQPYIHVYKFKHIDDTDLFVRLCFQDQAARRNCISPCIGKAYDSVTGYISDVNAYTENKEILSPAGGFKWEFGFWNNNTHNSYTYSQGFSTFGKGMVVGSRYHVIFLCTAGSNNQSRVNAILASSTLNYDVLDYPVLIGETYSNISSAGANYQMSNGRAYCGNIRVVLDQTPANGGNSLFATPQAASSFLPSNIDSFNTTTASPLFIYEYPTLQIIGLAHGMYAAKYGATNSPNTSMSESPILSNEIDFNNKCLIHNVNASTSSSAYTFLVTPIEVIKHGD